MAHFAMCSRASMYADKPADDPGAQDIVQSAPKRGKRRSRKWQSLNWETPPTPGNSKGGEMRGAAPSLPAKSTSPFTPHSQNMDSNDRTARMYIPPHLRKPYLESPSPVVISPEASKDSAAPSGETSPPKDLPGSTTHRPTSPPSPPSSPLPGNMAPKPEHQPKSVHRRHTRPPHKKTVWPKNRDMKAQPVEDESDGGVDCRSQSNGDPDYDLKKLVDWQGNWMPPSVEWSSRKTFTDRHFAQTIYQWAVSVDNAYGGKDQYGGINLAEDQEELKAAFIESGDIAPRQWIPVKIEGESPQQFWRHYPSRAPPALSDVDLEEYRPWWEYYVDNKKEFLGSLAVPEAAIDPSDECSKMPGTTTSADETVKAKEYARQERVRKQLERRNRPTNYSAMHMQDNTLKHTANIYLRPIYATDIDQILCIYNHYVKETISANEFNVRSVSQMTDRVNDITTRGLPWIVAVHSGTNYSHKQRGKVGFVSETIVGFANVDDYCDAGSSYRYTFEMEMYVHPDFFHQGIGKCMLDHLLSMVNPSYLAKGGYKWTVQGEYLKTGISRVVKTLNFTFPHDQDDNETVEWVTTFLKSFGFRKAGHLHRIGYKLGRCIDITIFQHSTGEEIAADVKPEVPL